MLTCDAVRDALPGIESGECASGAVRDHLATCADCRAEAARVRAEIARLRRDLAALAPSPFLEDAVVGDARASVDESTSRPRRVLWVGTGLALAAASLLVAVVFAARRDVEGPASPEDGPREAAVRAWMPPSAGDVRAGREANPPTFDHRVRADGKVLYRHWLRNASGGLTTFSSERIHPFEPELLHRWVCAPGEAGDRTLALDGALEPGVQIVGRGLWDRVLSVGGATWKEYLDDTRTSSEILVATPGANGAEIRLSAIFRPDYAGSVLLAEPLARALGLYQYEIPGRGVVQGAVAVPVRRARARVRVLLTRRDGSEPERRVVAAFDEVVEVQVRATGSEASAAASVGAGTTTFRFDGERPDVLLCGRRMHFTEDDVVTIEGAVQVVFGQGGRRAEVPIVREGSTRTLHASLSYGEADHPRCDLILPPLDVGGGQPGARQFTLERLTLRGRYEPGARVTVARVWRGYTAIPAQESVALTRVAVDGTVSFVREAGEQEGTLRMLLRGADGKARWSVIRLERSRLVLNVRQDGSVYVKRYRFQLVDPGARDGQPVGADADAVDGLRTVLGDLVSPQDDVRASAPPSVLVLAEAETPWRIIQWVLQVCASHEVGLRRLSFAVMNGDTRALRNDLPEDRGLTAPPRGEPAAAAIRIVLRPGASAGGTRFSARWEEMEIEGAVSGPGSALAALREAVRRRLASDAGVVEVVLAVLPPDGARVPYGDAHAVLRALKEAGAAQVLIEGAAR